MREYRIVVDNLLGHHVTVCHNERDLHERLRSLKPGGRLESTIWVESRDVGPWGTEMELSPRGPDGATALTKEERS